MWWMTFDLCLMLCVIDNIKDIGGGREKQTQNLTFFHPNMLYRGI